ncbi:Heptaprenyl diphosphate synthase component 2 [Mycobacterium tuberculosis CAS/NITR204]|uniref:Heptaprenyl diphosphate synthase component 2 n=1 Tax=Mycobacterium tuberculosis CAS/NITR204 TaxID=1310114 RepID=R4M5H5_MYCTX|nr:Heptaprenyl diphosphate synthase component 2 [Mycobacterium tuberculosis CAS/NITR204]
MAGVDLGDAVFAAAVRAGVARVEQLMDTELRQADEVMSDSLLHLFNAGGKRFRPLFTVLSAQIGPQPDAAAVTVAGAVIEMIHLATLYHDDVMDEAQVRRGAPTQRAMGQGVAPGWRLPTGHRIAAGGEVGTGGGADHRRHLRPVGDRADA